MDSALVLTLGRSIVDNKIRSKSSNSIAKLITFSSNLNLPMLQHLMLAVRSNCQKHLLFCPCSMAVILPEKKYLVALGSPVLKICFGPPTAESKNLKNHINFDVGDLFFRSPALWSSQNVFGPPTAGCVVVDFKDRVKMCLLRL